MSLATKFGNLDVYLSFDHSQLEIRVLAQMSGDKLLTDLIQSGEDIHSAVGHELTGISIEKIKKDRDTRTAVKGIHFGIIYGLTAKSLFARLKADAAERHQQFDMSFEDVERLYNRYFDRFAGVKKWLEEQVAFAMEHGYSKTMFGFKREISQVADEDRTTFWRNQAVNSPIQGTAHQLLLISLAIVEMKKQTYNLWQRMCMEIHDSLVTYVMLTNLPAAYKQGVYLLETDTLEYVKRHWPKIAWKIPLKAEAKVGFRMGVLVEGYAGGSIDEFIENWCIKNREFEKKMKKQMQEDLV
jgi:DNA polymerase I-like protein with 3'-5' exonuclease and polymerase domains